jgi:hypothetical protein
MVTVCAATSWGGPSGKRTRVSARREIAHDRYFVANPVNFCVRGQCMVVSVADPAPSYAIRSKGTGTACPELR